jgi:hypothetical protein
MLGVKSETLTSENCDIWVDVREWTVVFLVGGGKATYLTTALAIIVTVSVSACALGAGDTEDSSVRLSTAPLGVNVAPWDLAYAANTSVGGGLNITQPLLKAAGVDQLRYGGGSYADQYDWETNTNIGKCLPDNASASFTSACASPDPLSFSLFSQQANAIGADSFITVNYGSGTPSEAAAWVTAAVRTPGEQVALWEVGNEAYSCTEVDNELAGPPMKYQGYKPPSPTSTPAALPTCPQTTEGDAAGTKTMAISYAVNAQRFMRAMKAADSTARIGVPWAFSALVSGAAVPDSSEWNDIVLGMDGKYASFVDAHYYPFNFGGNTGNRNPTDEQVLRQLRQIPALYQNIRAELNIYAPNASVVIGETAVSNSPTTTACTPVGALFAAGDVLSWLAVGAQSVDWWDMNDSGNPAPRCINPDFGFFTSSSPPTTETPYYGYLLASVLARPHALLGTLATSDPLDILAFQSALPDGKHAIALINTDTNSPRTITFQPSTPLSGTLRTWNYGANAYRMITGTASAASVSRSITLPAESMIVLETKLSNQLVATSAER